MTKPFLFIEQELVSVKPKASVGSGLQEMNCFPGDLPVKRKKCSAVDV